MEEEKEGKGALKNNSFVDKKTSAKSMFSGQKPEERTESRI